MQSKLRVVEEHCRTLRLKKCRGETNEAKHALRKLVGAERVVGIRLQPLELNQIRVRWHRSQLEVIEERSRQPHDATNLVIVPRIHSAHSVEKDRQILGIGTEHVVVVDRLLACPSPYYRSRRALSSAI